MRLAETLKALSDADKNDLGITGAWFYARAENDAGRNANSVYGRSMWAAFEAMAVALDKLNETRPARAQKEG